VISRRPTITEAFVACPNSGRASPRSVLRVCTCERAAVGEETCWASMNLEHRSSAFIPRAWSRTALATANACAWLDGHESCHRLCFVSVSKCCSRRLIVVFVGLSLRTACHGQEYTHSHTNPHTPQTDGPTDLQIVRQTDGQTDTSTRTHRVI